MFIEVLLCSVADLFFFCCCPQVMKKSVIGPDFEKKDAVPPYSESKQALKLKHRVGFTKECFLETCIVCAISYEDKYYPQKQTASNESTILFKLLKCFS